MVTWMELCEKEEVVGFVFVWLASEACYIGNGLSNSEDGVRSRSSLMSVCFKKDLVVARCSCIIGDTDNHIAGNGIDR